MKKLLFTLFIACFTVVFANAQDAPKKKTSFGWDKASLTEIGCDAETIKKIAKGNATLADTLRHGWTGVIGTSNAFIKSCGS